MIKWKDFLYFSKGDKIGVLLLLILIFIVGSIYIYLGNFSKLDVGYYQSAESVQNEFVEFEEQLVQKEIVEDRQEEQSIPSTTSNKRKESAKLTSGQMVDINSVSSTTLMRIPGIGKTYADRIIEYRNALGGFCDLIQLKEVKGITNNKFVHVLPYLTIRKKHTVMNINRVSEDRLSKHPYLNEIQLNELLILRQDSKLESIDDLLVSPLFLPKDIDKLSPYISFE